MALNVALVAGDGNDSVASTASPCRELFAIA